MLRSYMLVSAVAVSMGLTACSSSPPPDVKGSTPDVSAERAYFDAHVQPTMDNVCSACHSTASDEFAAPDFLGLEGPENYYVALVNNTSLVPCNIENSMLLLKGLDPTHQGPDLSAEEQKNVESWLALEAIARFDGICSNDPPPVLPPPDTTGASGSGGTPVEPPPPEQQGPMTGQAAMESFGKCMELSVWNETGMPLVANQNSIFNGNELDGCYSCHNNFKEGNNAMPDPNAADGAAEIDKAHTQFQSMYAIFNLVRWSTNEADGSFKDIVKSYRWRDKGVTGGTSHPAYELRADRVASYEAWFDKTYTRWQASIQPGGTPCTPAAEPPPAP